MVQSQRPLRVLIVEDVDADARLIVHQLKRAGFDPEWTRVSIETDFLAALDSDLDVILADFNLPTFGAPRVLELLKARDNRVPVIVVSGSIGEETAVQMLQGGAADYLLKDRLTRLGASVQRAADERRLEREKRKAEDALNEAEERTHFALSAARVGVWEVDLRSGVARWSETLEELHGLPRGGFGGTLEAFLDRIHHDDRAGVARSIGAAAPNRTDSNVLYRTVWPDGTTHWINSTGKAFYDTTGTPVRAAGIGLDVTERHLLEEQQRQSQRVDSIGRLAGGIAHDFNNLLTAIRGYCDLLGDELGLDSRHGPDLLEIRRAADRATALTQQLLAFGRRQMLEPRVIDLRDELRGMESMLRRLIGEDLQVGVRVTDQAARIKADPSQVEQVILNLALNARDAMPEGGVLLLDVTRVDLDEAYARQHTGAMAGPYVMLAVSDTGVGMDPATQARIFEPFFTTKEKGKGTGLGLSTVYGIVKQMGGNIWVYSESGHGTTFKVYFPRVEEPVDRATPSLAPTSLTGTETILVVEDEGGVRELVRRALDRHGYRVLIAATPREAFAVCEQYDGPIHLLITDVVLPEMNGPSLASQLRAGRSHLRTLYMSGYTDNAMIDLGVLGADTPFIQKPFTPDSLARKVREVLG
jgi:two-component system, cell cycle sensor histidine kinase and response regulator CckA